MELLDAVTLALIFTPATLSPSEYRNDAMLGRIQLINHATGYWETRDGWTGPYATIAGAVNWTRGELASGRKDRHGVEIACRHLPCAATIGAWLKVHEDSGGWACWGHAWRDARDVRNTNSTIASRAWCLQRLADEIGWDRLYRGDLPLPPKR